VYPNPTENILNFHSDFEISKIEIVDFSGQVLLELTVNNSNGDLNLDKLTYGFYIVKFIDEKFQVIESIKILKN